MSCPSQGHLRMSKQFEQTEAGLTEVIIKGLLQATQWDWGLDECVTTVFAETAGTSGNEAAGEKRDVTPFRERLSTEVEKLTQLAQQWTALRESTTNLSEDGVY